GDGGGATPGGIAGEWRGGRSPLLQWDGVERGAASRSREFAGEWRGGRPHAPASSQGSGEGGGPTLPRVRRGVERGAEPPSPKGRYSGRSEDRSERARAE